MKTKLAILLFCSALAVTAGAMDAPNSRHVKTVIIDYGPRRCVVRFAWCFFFPCWP